MDNTSILLKSTLDNIHASLSTLQTIGLLDSNALTNIHNLLPSPNALSNIHNNTSSNNNPIVQSPGGSVISGGQSYNAQQQQQQREASASGGSSGGAAPSPYPAPQYGAAFANGQQMAGGVNRPAPPLPGRQQSPAIPSLPTATALWDYHGSAPDDLRFSKGDVINIVQEIDADWTRGSIASDPSRTGLFPSAYVSKNPPLPPRVDPSPSYNSSSPSSYPSDEKYAQSYQPQPQPSYNNQSQQPPYGQMQPYSGGGYQAQAPPQHYGALQAPGQGQIAVQPPAKEKKKFGMGGGLESIMATSAAGGVGFGAGSAVGSGIINAIF